MSVRKIQCGRKAQNFLNNLQNYGQSEISKINFFFLSDKIAAVAMNMDAKIAKTETPTVNLCNAQVDNFSNYDKMICVTSILLKPAENRLFKGVGKNISREHFHKAEVTWVKFVQMCLLDDWKTKFQRLGVAKND